MNVSDNDIHDSIIVFERDTYPAGMKSFYNMLYDDYKTYWECAEKIQVQWRKSISDPKYKVCQKRLLREFKEL